MLHSAPRRFWPTSDIRMAFSGLPHASSLPLCANAQQAPHHAELL